MTTYIQIYEKDNTVDIKKMGTIQKGRPHKYYPGKTVYNITQHAAGFVVNRQVKGKILAMKMFRLSIIKLSKSQDSFLKWVKENKKNKREKEK